MKKSFILLLSVVLSALLFVGCVNSNKTGELTETAFKASELASGFEITFSQKSGELIAKEGVVLLEIDEKKVLVAKKNGDFEKNEEIFTGNFKVTEIKSVLVPETNDESRIEVNVPKYGMLLGDFDGNGKVELMDFVAFARNYGSTLYLFDIAPARDSNFDEVFDLAKPDGKVDIDDLMIFANNYDETPAGFGKEDISFTVINYNAGPSVEGATVTLYNTFTDKKLDVKVTDVNGLAEFLNVSQKDAGPHVTVKIEKQGHALSMVEGVLLQDENYPAILMTAQLEGDVEVEKTDFGYPKVSVELFDEDFNPVSKKQPIKGTVLAVVSVEAGNHMNAIYEPLLGRIAGAGLVTTNRKYVGEATQAAFAIDTSAFNGVVPLYTTIYDQNKNRVLKVDYLNIVGSNSDVIEKYQPMPFNAFTNWWFMETALFQNMWTYTRRRGIALNSTSRGINELTKTEEVIENIRTLDQPVSVRSLDLKQRVAPENANLWTQLYWTDWSTADLMYQNFPEEFPNPGEQPDGYRLYRSLDGSNYEPFGYVTEEFLAYLAYSIVDYLGQGYTVTDIMNYFPMYLDPSEKLEAGEKMHYAIASVYGKLESDLTSLGSVVPLDSFNVNLESPAADATDVSVNPTFKWSPTKTLTSSEGTPTYVYNLFIYDWVQEDNGLIVPVYSDEDEFVDFVTQGATSVEMDFTLDSLLTTWKWWNPYSYAFQDYEGKQLEPNKTYNWGINYGFAIVADIDSRAYSITADYRYRDQGFLLDPAAVMEPDQQADFTTGAQ